MSGILQGFWWLKAVLIALTIGITTCVAGQVAFADGAPVVITIVQTADSLSASDEYIQIANNTSDDVDVTNWCLYYASASSTSLGSKLVCLVPTEAEGHIFLPGQSVVTAVSNQFQVANPNVTPDLYFSGGISGTGGHIRLVDSDEQTVDKVGWGTSVAAEGGAPAEAPSLVTILQRKLSSPFIYQDTDNNSTDFDVTTPLITFSHGAPYELVDACLNINGFQPDVPDDYSADATGQCMSNQCGNQGVSEEMTTEPQDDCNTIDVCTNLPGLQTKIPNGFVADDISICRWALLPIIVNELLPNPGGADAGREFIELYNPNDQAVSLQGFSLLIGAKQQDTFPISDTTTIAPGGYLVLYSDTYAFTLTNTEGQVQLVQPDQSVMSQSDPYTSANDDVAWALIDDVWQYTSMVTPGSANKLPTPTPSSVSVEPDDTSATLTPCSSGQYRNPDTNRCRKIPDQGSALTPCSEGQERNPTTNRCRSITTATKEPTPCKAGQERNPDTNRCRNVVNATPPKVDYGVLGAQTGPSSHYMTWAIVGVIALGVGYVIWEWRDEIGQLINRLRAKIRRRE